ncbi:MAG: sugar ABC transporter permease [Chloroflexi bacterium]|nr:sugar ABC transporter permease [Chloroflexota bacterium]
MQDIARMVREPTIKTRMGRRARREARDFYLFTGPWILGFLGLSLFPLAVGLLTSFTNYNGLNLDDIKFVALRNYTRAFESEDFTISLKNTFVYALFVVPVGNILALILAGMLNRALAGRAGFRTIYYLPSILPLAGAIQAWGLMFNTNAGAVNAFLSLFAPGTAINWVNQYFILMLLLFAWWQLGGAMVIYLAGLQGVPEELREAATIDGANSTQIFLNVTLPLLTPVIFFQAVLGIVGALQILDSAILLYGRAGLSGTVSLPGDLYMYMVYVYSQVFDFQRYGFGVALSWIFFIIVLVLTMILLFTSRYWVYYEVAQEGEKVK